MTETKKFVQSEWQAADIVKLSELDQSANWSEMGCFKTSTLLWLVQNKCAGLDTPRVMIVTTPSGKGTYFEAIPEILPEWTLFDATTRGLFLVKNGRKIKVSDSLKDINIKVPHIVLTHYHVFGKSNKGKIKVDKQKVPVLDESGSVIPLPWTSADHLMTWEWDFIALDEAHRIKNRKAKWTEHIKKCKTKYKHVMTGTGFINRPDEIWSLLHFLNRTRWSSYWKFRDDFCEIDMWTGYARIAGLKESMKPEFRSLVREIGVRRTLDEVMPHIKQPIFVKHPVELNATQRTMYDQIKKDLFLLDQKGEPIHSPNVLSMLNRLRQICVATPELINDRYDPILERRVQDVRLVEPSSKLDEVMEILDELQWDDEAKQQVVVFSNFKDPLELLKVRLDKAKIPYIHMDQKDNDEVRYKKWFHEFPKKEHQVFMCTLQLGSESINLTSARHVIFLDRSWSPKDNQQGVGRVRRPGQEGQPVVINVEAENTTDQRLERTNYEKVSWFNAIFGDEITE